MKIKICGIKRPGDVAYINQYQPDYLGFIINYPKSHRSISLEELAQLSPLVNKKIAKVGVFVNSPAQEIAPLLNKGLIDMAQLHGQEDEDFISQLRQLTRAPIWQAFSIKSQKDLARARASSADLVLLDHGSGGTGQAFNWSLIKDFQRPYLLAGGMNEKSLPLALEQLEPWGIDCSSGVETDRKKDPAKIEKMIRMVRNA